MTGREILSSESGMMTDTAMWQESPRQPYYRIRSDERRFLGPNPFPNLKAEINWLEGELILFPDDQILVYCRQCVLQRMRYVGQRRAV